MGRLLEENHFNVLFQWVNSEKYRKKAVVRAVPITNESRAALSLFRIVSMFDYFSTMEVFLDDLYVSFYHLLLSSSSSLSSLAILTASHSTSTTSAFGGFAFFTSSTVGFVEGLLLGTDV